MKLQMTVMLLQNNVSVHNNNNNNNINNHNNNNNLSKGGPTTIEDQFREHFSKNETSPSENRPRLNVFSLPHTGYPKRQGKAMNYYRLWIYTCNAVLLVSVLGFVIVAGKVVLIDPRRSLIPGLTLHEPSLLYAYLALLTQSGLLQLLGCIGAHKLNEKLLNMYWFLLLFLLFGDAFIGVVWIFRFDKMYTDIRPLLRQRLQMEYGVNEEFTRLWDNIQNDFRCCGVEGPQDFNEIDLAKRNPHEKKANDTRHTQRKNAYEESDRNRVITNRSNNWNFRESSKGSTVALDDNTTDGVKDFKENTNSFSSTMFSSTTSSSNDFSTVEPALKYIRNVPESCCRVLMEEVPDENKEEKVDEPQSKPTAIRQRLEKKKNRHQENKMLKRNVASLFGEPSCKDLKKCKSSSKRHILDTKLLLLGGHIRHESLYKNTHHYATSTNAVVPNVTHEKKTKEPKYATGNLDIMDTCAKVNGHPVGTVYGLTETLHYSVGCEVKLKKWLRDSAHVLGVLGYCVIAFLKLCFLGILRYEIREMIQKIKMLQGELQPPVLLLSAESPSENPEMNSPVSPHALCNHTEPSSHLTNLNKSHTVIPSESLRDIPDRMRANSLGSAFLLRQPPESGQTTPAHHQIKTIQSTQQRMFNGMLAADTGNDSDTNSHCALLIDGADEVPIRKKHSRVSSNGNNNYESHELQDLLARHSAQI